MITMKGGKALQTHFMVEIDMRPCFISPVWKQKVNGLHRLLLLTYSHEGRANLKPDPNRYLKLASLRSVISACMGPSTSRSMGSSDSASLAEDSSLLSDSSLAVIVSNRPRVSSAY